MEKKSVSARKLPDRAWELLQRGGCMGEHTPAWEMGWGSILKKQTNKKQVLLIAPFGNSIPNLLCLILRIEKLKDALEKK